MIIEDMLGALRSGLGESAVTDLSDMTKFDDHPFGNLLGDFLVRSKPKRNMAHKCQRYIIARQIYTLKCIAFLEIAQRIPTPLPVGKVRVDEERNISFSAHLNSTR